MTAPRTGGPSRFDWEREGMAVGTTLDATHAVVVLGDDPVATTLVALGIGRAQSGRRRVAVGDLFGEAPPIEALVTGDDPHGIVDSFVYGVSLNRIARPVEGEGELFVMPSGSEPIDHEEVLPHPRWRRLASGFREVGALLVLAAPASAPKVEELVAATDGAVLVGELVPPQLAVAQVLAGVRAPRPTPAPAVTGLPDEPAGTTAAAAPAARSWTRWAVGGLILAALGAIVAWLAWRPYADGPARPTRPPRDTAVASTQLPITPPGAGASVGAVDTTAIDTTRPPGAVAGPITNPADSLRAVAWAVGFKNFNTPAGVLLALHGARNALPAATYAPVQQQGATWYQLVAGAFADRRAADSLLAAARSRRDPELEPVVVGRFPLAYVVHARVTPADAPRLVGQLVERGHPAYGLRQADGTVTIYVGAFESAAQAAPLGAALQSSGLAPALAYRLGRVF